MKLKPNYRTHKKSVQFGFYYFQRGCLLLPSYY